MLNKIVTFQKKNEFKIKIESEVRKGDFLPIGLQPIFPLQLFDNFL